MSPLYPRLVTACVHYDGIVDASQSRVGELHLFRRGRFGFRRHAAFHPAWEWVEFTIRDRGRGATVVLTPPAEIEARRAQWYAEHLRIDV